jgi:hypothetical protein
LKPRGSGGAQTSIDKRGGVWHIYSTLACLSAGIAFEKNQELFYAPGPDAAIAV